MAGCWIRLGAALVAGWFVADWLVTPTHAQVRRASPETSGVARRAAPETTTDRSSDADRGNARRTSSRGGFGVGFRFNYNLPAVVYSRPYVTRSFYRRGYLVDDYYYGHPGAYCHQCGTILGGCACGGPFILPPVYADAGQAYGPRAALRFLQGDPPVNNALAVGGRAAANAGPIAPPRDRAAAPRVAAFGDQARGRAWKFIDYGDKQFKKGRYREAAKRYRKAAGADSRLGEAQFRLGWTELAMGNLGRASVAFRRGLLIDPAWPGSDFVLEDLFDDKTRTSLFAQLDERLEAMPNDVDARFVLGVAKHFDGQPADAQRAFARVQQLTGGDQAAALFLPPREQAAQPEQPGQEAKP